MYYIYSKQKLYQVNLCIKYILYYEKEKSILFFLCVFGLSSLYYLNKNFRNKIQKCQTKDSLFRSRNKEPLKNNKNIILFQALLMKLYQKKSLHL